MICNHDEWVHKNKNKLKCKTCGKTLDYAIIQGAIALLKGAYDAWQLAIEKRNAIPHKALSADEYYDQWAIASHEANMYWYCWSGIGNVMRVLLPNMLGLRYTQIQKIVEKISKETDYAD